MAVEGVIRAAVVPVATGVKGPRLLVVDSYHWYCMPVPEVLPGKVITALEPGHTSVGDAVIVPDVVVPLQGTGSAFHCVVWQFESVPHDALVFTCR